MKTFKMVSFGIMKDDEVHDIPLLDGIIINQNNNDDTWILEAFITKDHLKYFEEFKDSGDEFDVQVIITSSDNDPAPFHVKVETITEIDEKFSILMKGTVTVRTKYTVTLLKTLLEEDLSNEELLQRFEQGLRERPRLKDI